MGTKGWIGVDLDGTLAHYTGYKGADIIGDPIPKMLSRVKRWVKDNKDVRIFTARADNDKSRKAIQDWCTKYLGTVLPITNKKDLNMIELWDDRCVQVITNTGLRADTKLKIK